MKQLLTITILIISSLLRAQSNYYVSPIGSDLAVGDVFNPFQTINHALGVATPGTTVFVMGGTYCEVIFMPSGTSGNPIKLTNYSTQIATLTSPLGNTDAIININNVSFVTIEGLEITGYAANDARGIEVTGQCTDILLRNNKIHDINFSSNPNDPVNATTNAQPIIVYGTGSNTPSSNIRIEGNEVYSCRTGFSEAVAINGNVAGFFIENNVVHDNTNIGIDAIGFEGTCANIALDIARDGVIRWNKVYNCVSAYATSAGIYTDGARNIVIENNTVYGNGYGIEAGCETVGQSSSDIIIRNNLVHHNIVAGIAIGGFDYPTGSGKVELVIVQQNTLVQNNTAGGDAEILINYTEYASVKGNLVYNITHPELLIDEASSIGLSSNYNLFYAGAPAQFLHNGNIYTGIVSWQNAVGRDTNSIELDPLLVNVGSWNFHLQSSSPCIDTGDVTFTASLSETDIDTSSRLQNGRVDIGADEYGTAVDIRIWTINNTFTVIPDCVNNLLQINWESPLSNDEVVFLTDIQGKQISSTSIHAGAQYSSMSIQNLASGTYYVRLNSSNTAVPFVITR